MEIGRSLKEGLNNTLQKDEEKLTVDCSDHFFFMLSFLGVRANHFITQGRRRVFMEVPRACPRGSMIDFWRNIAKKGGVTLG